METLSYSPVLNTPCYNPLDLDEIGLWRGLEMIAFPKTAVQVLCAEGKFYQVLVDGYNSSASLYIPKVFIGPGKGKKRLIPSKKVMLERLLNTPKLPYVWGGNVSSGINIERVFKPPVGALKNKWSLVGIDCSGLLYEVANGAIPRNTSQLADYGCEVVSDVKPLDICILPGHVFVVVGKNLTLESKHEWGGVVFSKLDERLKLIKQPFVFRRIF